MIVVYNGTTLKQIYNNGKTADEIENMTYDVDTNTLIFNNYKNDVEIDIKNLGEDFKINLIGDNEID